MAMTTQAPDPREFKTSDDAFAYPIPTVRRMEQQLRSTMTENRDKLRNLVGTSYRELLGTADRIIEMDGQMREAETLLGEVGRKCNARAVERIAANHARIVRAQRERGGREKGIASQVKVLENCLAAAVRVVKGGRSPLLAAELVVLARLLHGSVAKTQQQQQGGGDGIVLFPLLDTLRSRLTGLRKRLLGYIDRKLANAEAEKTALVEALAAFSLATTSTPTDVLKHFLNVRGEALADALELQTEEGAHKALTVLLSTLKDAKAVFPKRLSEILGRLQAEPLMKVDAVRKTEELALDVHERWIADDVRNFSPWLRHDQLKGDAATRIVASWAVEAKKRLVQGLKTLLGGMDDARKVIKVRKQFIGRVLAADRQLPGLEATSFFEDLRTCFIDGLRKVAADAANELTSVIATALKDESVEEDKKSATDLWDPSVVAMDLSRGAVDFRNAIVNCNYGHDRSLQTLDNSLGQWAARMSGLAATIKVMREDRWDDDLELDIEDDLDLDSPPQDLLSRSDPETLNSQLREQSNLALSSVYEQLSSAVSDNAPDHSSRDLTFLLRLLRQVLQHAHSSAASSPTAFPVTPPPSALLDMLHERLAAQITSQAASNAKRQTGGYSPFSHNVPPALMLWEGTAPALPVQPSVSCFRFLHDTCKAMKSKGGDLWTPPAAAALKKRLRVIAVDAAQQLLLTKVNGKEEKNGTPKSPASSNEQETKEDEQSIGKDDDESEGTAKQEPSAAAAAETTNTDTATESETRDRNRDVLIQTLYDLLYLSKLTSLSAGPAPHATNGSSTDAAAATTTTTTAAYETVIQELKTRTSLDGGAVDRLAKSVGEYYKRTYLLFGLLAA